MTSPSAGRLIANSISVVSLASPVVDLGISNFLKFSRSALPLLSTVAAISACPAEFTTENVSSR